MHKDICHTFILSQWFKTTFIHIPYTYGNFLDAFHLYQNIIKIAQYSQQFNKKASF